MVQGQPSHRRRWWQRPKRQLQARVRHRAVDFYRDQRCRGSTLAEVARRLRLCPRTLRHWHSACRQNPPMAALLGRPKARSDWRQRHQVIDVLKHHGPRIGVPALAELFPALARAELAELLLRYRRVLHRRYRDTIRVCCWPIAGRVWALDLAEPSESGECLPPIDGGYPCLLAARDLASGHQLAWLPLRAATAEAVEAVLSYLFARHGPPLVLKMDNGPPLRAEGTKELLVLSGVMPLYSPVYYPQYNGSVEAGIGSLKTRTAMQAAQHGRVACWTWDDVEAARHEANETLRLRGPIPSATWSSRTEITDAERVRFELAVECQRMLARTQEGIGLEEDLDHWRQSAVDRKAIERALVAHGYLLYSRRRIPLRIKPKKVANIP